jgi:hypothetical protein
MSKGIKWVVSKEKRALLCDNARFLAPLGSPVEKKLSRIVWKSFFSANLQGAGNGNRTRTETASSDKRIYEATIRF